MSRFPGGARFAFTILDDTDDATVANVRPIYRLLKSLGIRITKTAWPFACPPELQGPFFAASTLQDPSYLRFVKELVADGFELGFHNATMGSSLRGATVEALDFLEAEFGEAPVVHANHGLNRENLYWGANRYRTSAIRVPVAVISRLLRRPPFEGDVEGSPYFWGDVARERLRYVRAFAFARLDTGRIPPGGPYHDPTTPWVNLWFNTSDAPDADAFKTLVTEEGIESLRARGSYTIVSTHLGKGFVTDGRVDPGVEEILRYVASLDGWSVPVSALLDHLVDTRGERVMEPHTRWRLDASHIVDRILTRLRH